MAKVEADKVPVVNGGSIVGAGNFDENKEYHRNYEEKGCEECEDLARSSCSFDL